MFLLASDPSARSVAAFDDDAWEDLLNFIDEKQVIPDHRARAGGGADRRPPRETSIAHRPPPMTEIGNRHSPIGNSASSADTENPWPGLATFTEEQSNLFHGRDDEIRDLSRRAERNALTVLFGQSGLANPRCSRRASSPGWARPATGRFTCGATSGSPLRSSTWTGGPRRSGPSLRP